MVAASRKEAKHAALESRYIFEPIAVKTLGVFKIFCLPSFKWDWQVSLLTLVSLDSRETKFLSQRASVLVQQFNAVLLHDTMPAADCTD